MLTPFSLKILDQLIQCAFFNKPENATDPYIYVPIAEFNKVGAKVVWNEQKQILTVTSNYYELQQKIADIKKIIGN